MNKPKTRNNDIVVQEMENEILIYDSIIDKAYCLNETSARVYQLCNGQNSVAEISQQLSKQSKQSMTEDLIWLALDGFKKDNLLEQSEQFEINFNGLNRRQVIRKIGLTSLAVLPVVASIVAPSAAAAASTRANLASCSNPSQCQSNNCVSNASGSPTCCASGAGSGGSAVSPGSGTCTPTGTCATTYNATRCCTQRGTVPGSFTCGGLPDLEPCRCL